MNPASLSSFLRQPKMAAPMVLAVSTLTTGCAVKGSGHIVDEHYDVARYDSIDLGDGFVGHVTQGSEYSVLVEADDNLIDDVRVVVRGGVLTVDLDDLSTRQATLRATFVMPIARGASVSDGSILDIEAVPLEDDFSLDLSGGSMGRVTQMPGEQFDTMLIDSSGGSSFDVSASAATTLIDISSGGSGRLRGTTETMTTSLSGGSTVDAGAFLTQNLSFDFSGGSTADVLVRSTACGELSGGSVLDVSGGADVRADTSGGSTVRQRN